MQVIAQSPFSSHTMSDSESATPPPEATHDVLFSGCLSTYTKVPGKKGKEIKKNKTKEFDFVVSDVNYLELLRACLESHGIEQYQVSVKQRYTFNDMIHTRMLHDE